MEQRHLAYFSAFSMNCESAHDPIDIIECKSFYFAGPQPEHKREAAGKLEIYKAAETMKLAAKNQQVSTIPTTMGKPN
jgi:hypothetical protein